MCRQRAGDARRAAGQVHDHGTLGIETGEIVVVGLGHDEPVAGEDEPGVHGWRRIDAHAERGVGPERERLALPSRIRARL